MTVKETAKAVVPVAKVGAGALAGAATVVVFYVLGELWDIHPTAEVGSAVTVLLTFLAGWFTPAKEA
jgi:ABC-type Fe3+-siderophore transport system permease subunit